MGYCTYYSLSMEDSKPGDAQKVYAEAYKQDMEFCTVFIEPVSEQQDYFDTRDAAKWYDHENEMRALSQIFSHILFALHGEGDNSEDIWNEYYRAGKMQRCVAEIIIPPFDESEMR